MNNINKIGALLSRKRWMTAAAVAASIFLMWWLFSPKPLKLELATANVGSMMVSIDNLGMVRMRDHYVVASPVAASMQRMPLRVGDQVRQGDVVAYLLPLPVDIQNRQQIRARLNAATAHVTEMRLQHKQAQADFQLATRERLRISRLVQEKFLSRQAEDKAVTAEETARAVAQAAHARELAATAEAESARAADEAIHQSPHQTITLRAPVSGKIIKVQQQSERTLAAGTPLITIGDPTRFEVVVDVLSTDAVKAKPGMTVLLQDWGGPAALRAQVRLIEPVAFTKISALGIEEQRVNVIADPIDNLESLGDGYRVEARIIIWRSEWVLKIPSSSVFRVGDKWHVFVIENNRARSRAVQVGWRNPDEVQIISGIEAGAQVVRFTGNQLRDGDLVAQAS